MNIEDCLLLLIFSILVYFIVLLVSEILHEPPILNTTILGGKSASPLAKSDIRVASPRNSSSPSSPTRKSSPSSTPRSSSHKKNNRPDNIKADDLDPVKLSKKINKYDEYDDDALLRELDPKMIKSFDNIVIDGTNFIYAYRDYKGTKNTNMDATEQLSLIKKSVALLSSHFPTKNLYFVFKDPENEKQTADLIKTLEVETVKQAHKKFFTELAKSHPKSRFVVAYGDAKYRDDYAAIWLSDTLPDETILLSRDRFRDVADMASATLKFKTYGKRASSIDKIINKPFNFVTKGAVKSALVGYSFSKKKKSGFYDKVVNRKSDASESVYIIKL